MKKVIVIIGIFICTRLTAQTIRLDMPPASPGLFAEGIVSTGERERDMAISPDGKEMFYTVQAPLNLFQTMVYRKKNSDGTWSKPVIPSFAGRFSDLEPAFSADGSKLFFSSNRPLTGESAKDFDIWYTEKKNGEWQEAVNIGLPVNTAADEFYPSITQKGNLYFTAAYKAGIGKEDIFMAAWKGDRYAEPVVLDTAVNSVTYEFNAFVSQDEQYIIFTSWGRKDDKGKGDLYMSKKDAAGNWLPARNMALLNSEKIDYCPFLSFDNKVLFFTSERHAIPSSYNKAVNYANFSQSLKNPLNGNGNIYWVDFAVVVKSLFP